MFFSRMAKAPSCTIHGVAIDPSEPRTATRSDHSEMSPTKTPKSSSILDEIEASLASGNVRHRLKLLQHVTDLFVAGSRRYSGAEIAQFDDVLLQLATEIEMEARKRLAQRMAPLPDAPPKVIRRLAFDDAIAVA